MKTILSISLKKVCLLFGIISISLGTTTAQSLQWLEGMGSAGGDYGSTIKTDATGNVITGGVFTNTVDFNTTAATNSLAATSTYTNGFVFKQTAAGVFTWVQGFVGAGNALVNDITTDATGNVYITGSFSGSIDFNPGAGVSTLTTSATTNYDLYVCKLTSAGVFVWAKQIGGTINDAGSSVALDASGNVFIGGYAGTSSPAVPLDLNPSAATNTFTFGGLDAIIVKLDNAGNYVNAINYGTTTTEAVYTLKVDASNNVIVGGYYNSAIPQLGLTGGLPGSIGYGYIAKFNNTLTSTWAVKFNPIQYGNARVFDIELDATGNIYATGDIMTSGTNQINMCGTTNTITLTTSQLLSDDYDAFLCKMDPAGAMLWAKNVGYGRNNSRGTDLSLDAANNIYLIGYYVEWIDFNFGGGVPYYKSSVGGTANDYFVSKYNSNGVFSNDAQSYGNGGDDLGNGIQATSAGTYYVTGQFATTVGFSPFVAINNLTVVGATDIFIVKYANCTVPSAPAAATPTAITMCANTTTVMSVTSVPGYTYTWYPLSYTGAPSATGTSYTTPVITVTSDYWAQATNTCAASPRTQFYITVSGTTPTVTVTASSPSICAGQSTTLTASGATSYFWSGGLPAGSTAVATPSATTTYSILGNTGSCNGTKTITIVVNSSPTVAVSNQTTCAGTSVNLIASGATTYSWNTGITTSSISVTPTANTIYSVIGTTSGCTNTKTVSVTVNASPTVAVNGSTICAGASTNISATGATSYSWNTGATTSSISVTPTLTTTYSVIGTTTGCSNTKTVTVTVNALPNTSVASTTICSGSTGTLAASGASTYAWNTGASGPNLAVSPTANTNYTVTGTSAAGCVKTATAIVSVGSAPSIAANSTSICIGSSATITASGVNTYTWNTSSNSSSITVNPTSTTVYTVSGNLVGCATTAVKVVTVTVNALPVVTLTSISSPLCLNNAPVTLSGSPIGGAYSGTGVSSNSFDPSIAGAGTFTVTYNYTDANSCSATDSKTVNVSLCTSLTEAFEVNPGINIYPNPNNGDFTILIATKGTYIIVNAIGQTVKTIELKEDAQSINVSGLSQGIYYLVGKTAKVKIVVTH